MNPLIAIGFVAFFVSALTVGIRLLLLWRRTQQLPELLIGVGVLGIGPVGFGFQLCGLQLLTKGINAEGLFFVAHVAITAGVIAKLEFNHRVYHAANGAWLVLARTCGAIMLAFVVYHMFFSQFTPPPGRADWISNIRSMMQAFALLWGATEALIFWSQMRKRSKLGMASLELTQRFLLWGIGAGAAGLGTGMGALVGMIVGQRMLEIPWVVAMSSGMGFIAAAAMWLAFIPPQAYIRWVRRSDPATAEGTASDLAPPA